MTTILPFAPPRSAPARADTLLDPLPLLHDEPDTLLDDPSGAWRPSLLGQLLAAADAAERRRTVRSLLQALGFRWLAYTRLGVQGERLLPQACCTSHADLDWLLRYFCASYHRVDPRLQAALQSPLPCVWSIESLRRSADDTPLARAFVDDLQAGGARSGALLALPGDSEHTRHVVSLTSDRDGSQWMDDALLGQVITLGLCLHELYTRHMPPPVRPALAEAGSAAGLVLTPLQREILDCLVLGLGDKQIAARLSMSLHNVDYHLRQLRRRFDVHNRVQLTQAALRAGWR